MLAAIAVGVALALRHRSAGDLVLLAFFLPAFLAAAVYRFVDERFFVHLVPVAAVLVARAATAAGARRGGGRAVQLALGLALALLVEDGLLRSAWQGVLASLPDSRALAGGWVAARLPPSARIATEGYHLFGLASRPATHFLDPRQPVGAEPGKADVVVLNSAEHARFQQDRVLHPEPVVRFHPDLGGRTTAVKTVALQPRGFLHPTVLVRHPPDGISASAAGE